MSILFSLLLSLSSYAVATDAKSCTVLLEVFDENVNPPFGHGKALMQLLAKSKNHKIVTRKGAAFYVHTTDVNQLLTKVGRSNVVIRQVKVDGYNIPLYEVKPAGEFFKPTQELYQAMGQLAEGRYVLHTGKQKATMFIEHRSLEKPIHNRGISLEVRLYPGVHAFEPTDIKTIVAVSTGLGIDGYQVVNSPAIRAIWIYTILPYGMGDVGFLFTYGRGLPFVSVRTDDGMSYELDAFYPLKTRATAVK